MRSTVASVLVFSILGIFISCGGGTDSRSDGSEPEKTETSAFADTQQMERGRKKYDAMCASCHGPSAAGMKVLNAPALAGNAAWYLTQQLNYFRNGVRGADPDHIPGTQMAAIAKTITEDADVEAISAYLSSLETEVKNASLEGDAANGKLIYQNVCSACHGTKAEGIESLYAPKLTVLNDWYILSQLKQFKFGSRGTVKGDARGRQMRAIMDMVGDEKEMQDIAVYISTLKTSGS